MTTAEVAHAEYGGVDENETGTCDDVEMAKSAMPATFVFKWRKLEKSRCWSHGHGVLDG